MSDTFYHGVEIVEVDDGIRPIRTVRSSVIGVVGTAPDSAPEVKASLAAGGMRFTSKLPGALGNQSSIHLRNPRTNNAALAVSVSGRDIVVDLATGADGEVTTTETALAAAIAADEAAAALVDATGSGTAVAPSTFRPVYLTGGEDEAFPLNTPVLLAGEQRKAAKLGKRGTLPDAARGIFAQTGAVVVFVRVEEGEDDQDTMQNVIGGVDGVTGRYLGVHALLGAESETGFCPRILIAPGFTHQIPVPYARNPVVAELEGIANRLRGVIIADGPNTTDAAAIDARRSYGSKRVYFHEVFYTIMKDGAPVNVPASSYIAGLFARNDNERGYWTSPSNQEIFGIIGTARKIDYTPGDANSRANLLNENEVATTIRMDGFRLWGNRTCASDQKWSFITRVRINDMFNESLLQSHQWAVDKNITRTYFEDVSEGVNAYIARMVGLGAVAGGRCWADKELNTKENIETGQSIFSVEFSDYLPAERVTFRVAIVNDYLEEIL